jgi:mRNA interferase MazF
MDGGTRSITGNRKYMGVVKPKRGEIWWVNFDPSTGSEIKKLRPAIIVSNDSANKYLDRYQVIPLTSSITRVYPGECLIKVNKKQGKAMSNQIMSISKMRLGKKLGKVTREEALAIDSAIRVQLGII